MTGKTAPGSGEPANALPDPSPPVLGLARLRDALDRGLDRIEAIALEQAASLQQDAPDRERALREQVEVMGATVARLQAEATRREQQWQAGLQQLESDRRLIADAWERLEQAQVDAPQRSNADAERPATAPPPAPAEPVPRQSADETADDPVTRAILRQFQALQGDVRRNARGRNGR